MAIYNLLAQAPFSEVEPSAGYWNRCPVLKTVPLQDILHAVPDHEQPPYPRKVEQELKLLKDLYDNRTKPDQLTKLGGPLSRFLTEDVFLEEPPTGAVLRKPRDGEKPRVSTGLELATLFESEPPGLWHRHVLDVLFDPRRRLFNGPGNPSPADLSPPLQALAYCALDIAVSSALHAAWHFKWVSPDLGPQQQQEQQDPRIAYRQRPIEAPGGLTVLFDTRVELTPDRRFFTDRVEGGKPGPTPSPGTPRHPSYPSGHSTFSKAASVVLGCLFPDFDADFQLLADNIGWARLWGGVHWRSDHEFGQKVGAAVGKLVIDQLNHTGILPAHQLIEHKPPGPVDLNARDEAFGEKCSSSTSDFRQGIWPGKNVVQQVPI